MSKSNSSREPIAVLGMALRLPGGISTPEQFWNALATGKDLISTVPTERWDGASFQGSDPDEPGTTYDLHGGFISDVDAFDADFFKISSREASRSDPQQRLLLELTWEALERSSINPQNLAQSQTGIWIGISNNDWTRMLLQDPRKIDGYTGVGAAGSVVAGRIAHFLGTYGPAEVIDTACSSSLVALHHAVESLRRRETNLAIAGGANLILSPELHVCFSRTGMLSRSGQCHTFDNAADGYVRGEACCAIVLKRLTDAERDRDPILAVIRGTSVNQDGRSARLTAPNIRAQQNLMRSALTDAGIEASSVNYVEAHGTGTPLGDPMEFLSIGAVFGDRSRENPLRIGSVKTNLGHGEGAAGLTGLIKVVLMLQPGHGIAPHLHCSSPSSRIDWQKWPIEVPTTLIPWPKENEIHFAGVSSFSFSGTNAHAIVSSVAALSDTVSNLRSGDAALCISAANPHALGALARLYVEFLRQTGESFADICESALYRRARLAHRLVVRASDSIAAAKALEKWHKGDSAPGVVSGFDGATSDPGNGDGLSRLATSFLSGEKLPTPCRIPKHLALPLYPFQRQRFWFGEDPATEWRLSRERVWQAACAEATRESQKGPLGWNPKSYPKRWALLERLTLAYARNVLIQLRAFPDGNFVAVEKVMHACGFQMIYGRLVTRWLRNLAAVGVLVESEEGFRPVEGFGHVALDGLWRDVERELADDPGMLAYLRRSGDLLADVLTGRISPLETLFPGGSFDLADALYQRSSEARYCNGIAANALRILVQGLGAKRNVRILEIGAGTGGTTSASLPLLPPHQTEYWFTDVSDLFLRRARHKFTEFPFVRYAALNLDREPEEQNVPVGYFDVVVAANAVHATGNLPLSLSRIRRLLAPGGTLVLIETTVHQTCFDMSIGLIEGWQHFDDSERAEHPLLNAERWCEILKESGFEYAEALPSRNSPASLVGQHVVMAQRDFGPRQESIHVSAKDDEAVNAQDLRYLHRDRVTPAADLAGLPEAECTAEVNKIVRQVICRICQLESSGETLNNRDRLGDLGMDSLIALELRSELGKALGLEGKISATIGFDTGTVGELTQRLVMLLVDKKPNKDPKESKDSAARAPFALDIETLEAMTDAEVEGLLRERMGKG